MFISLRYDILNKQHISHGFHIRRPWVLCLYYAILVKNVFTYKKKTKQETVREGAVFYVSGNNQ